MVQMALIGPMHDFAAWRDAPIPLQADLTAGLRMFYDETLGTIRRYLPNVGKDKNADPVDSWYLYYPLMNLARLAIAGDTGARDLFDRSVEFAIRSARHFRYKWPIQYDITDFSVITQVAPADHKGQTDVGGLYAWVMLEGYELSRDERFFKRRIRSGEGGIIVILHVWLPIGVVSYFVASSESRYPDKDGQAPLQRRSSLR